VGTKPATWRTTAKVRKVNTFSYLIFLCSTIVGSSDGTSKNCAILDIIISSRTRESPVNLSAARSLQSSASTPTRCFTQAGRSRLSASSRIVDDTVVRGPTGILFVLISLRPNIRRQRLRAHHQHTFVRRHIYIFVCGFNGSWRLKYAGSEGGNYKATLLWLHSTRLDGRNRNHLGLIHSAVGREGSGRRCLQLC
jgi:hypothetical protein